MTGPVLVIGASGKLGREVVRQLQAAGYTTRCATRNPDRHPDLGDHRIRFDWNSPLTFEPALDGVSRVFLAARPLDIAAAAVLPGFIDECRTAAVEHVVFSSALGADVFKAGPLALVESYLRHSGLVWTILRPNFFMENFSVGWLAPDIHAVGRIALPAGTGRTSFISVRDVAAVAVHVFGHEACRLQEYNLTGDDPMSHTAVAAALTRASGRPVNYHALSEDEMREQGRRLGMPGGALEYLLMLYAVVRAGHAGRTSSAVADLLGRKPLGFEEFARDNAACWRVVSDHAEA